MWNWTAHQVEIYWIRHGKTKANESKCYLGRTDEGLSEAGRLELVHKKKTYPQADIIVGSPMLRCRQTAELLYPGQEIKTFSDWREMDFGIFEGKNYKELSNTPEYQAWIDSNAVMQIPGGESQKSFIKRCKAGMEELIAYLEEKIDFSAAGKKMCVAAVVHGGTIMALLSSYGIENKDYFSYSCSNGEGYRTILCWEYLEGKKAKIGANREDKTVIRAISLHTFL